MVFQRLRNKKMRIWILAGAALLVVSATPSFAVVYPWCASSGMVAPSPVCDFETMNQCQTYLSGIGGSCIRNPAYASAPTAQPMPTNAPPGVAAKRR
jgi:hypothetical protein